MEIVVYLNSEYKEDYSLGSKHAQPRCGVFLCLNVKFSDFNTFIYENVCSLKINVYLYTIKLKQHAMTTIKEIITNGNHFNIVFSNYKRSGYISFAEATNIIQTLFTNGTLNVCPNDLILDENSAIKFAQKIRLKFSKAGFEVFANLEVDNGNCYFDGLGNSYIIITK